MRHAALAAALILGFLAHLAGDWIRGVKLVSQNPDELMYLPESRVLHAAALGHSNLLADVIWLRAIQYYGEHRLTDRNYPEAERLFRTIYDLDPAFKGATRFGALILAQDARDPSGALELLERAERDHPRAWEYPFDQGFIHQAIRKSYAEAAEDYRRASQKPGAPDLAARLAGLSYARLGDRSAARDVWNAVLADPPNEMMRRIAARGLKNLELEETEEHLTQVVAHFKEKRGRFPDEWREIAEAGLLKEPPVEPFGGKYFIDPSDGKVRATTTIDREMKRQREVVRNALAAAHAKMGAYPGTLELLVRMGLLDQAPWRPLGVALTYDPASGSVEWNPPWPPSNDERTE
jgi:tetratricopeptide (TPR) repeat protein